MNSKIKIIVTIFIAFMPYLAKAQFHVDEDSGIFENIIAGYSTIPDIESVYTHNHDTVLLNKEVLPTNGSEGNQPADAFMYRSRGIIFTFDRGNMITDGIYLVQPADFKTKKGLKITLGQTSLKEVYDKYPDPKVGTCDASPFWEISIEKMTLFVKKLPAHQIFGGNELYYMTQPIVEARIQSGREFEETKDSMNCRCARPLYAPDSIRHLNCERIGHGSWYEFISPMTLTPNGYWMNYYPNHHLEEEGSYDTTGEKIGVWRYYDSNGGFQTTETYSGRKLHIPLPVRVLIVLGLAIISLFVILKKFGKRSHT